MCKIKQSLCLIILIVSLSACTSVQQTSEIDLALGQTVYEENCASCHGVQGEGQPNWKQPGQDGKLPAPPHDNTGHTWHHSDSLLLQIIAKGSGASNSNMLGYAEQLTQNEMEASLAYIKTFWGQQEQDFQMQLTEQEKAQQ